MYRIVHAEPDLSAVPAEVRGLIEACLAKDPRQRPDLGQVASYSTAAAERLGLSPAAFWPPEVARVIQAQQDALTAQIEALQLAPAGPAPLTAAPAGPSYPAGLSYLASPAPSAYLSVPAPAPTPPPPGPAPTTAPGRGAGQLAPRGTSRRGVLIGAGVGGVAVIGGALGWVLSDRSPGNRGSASTGIGSAAVPTASSLSQYYGEGTRRKAQWRFRTGNAVEANPGAGGGLAYVGSSDNNVYAVSLASGDKAWSFPAASVTAAPQVIGSVVCLATQEGDFYALDAATGKRAWHVSGVTDAIYKRSWAAAGTQVILAGTDGTAVQAYDAASGAKGMSFTTQDSYVYTMTAAGGVLYAVDVSGILYAFRIADGTVIWHRQLLSDFSSNAPGTSLTVDNGSLYLGTTGGTLYALRTADGGQRWTYPPGSGMESDLTVSGGIVYLRDNNGTVHAVSAATGKRVWTKSAPGAGLYGPAVAGGRVYYSTDLALQALDARSGDPDWAFSPDSTALPSTPAVAGGLVLIGCQDDSLYAVKA
jgi:outer membrane protein assembly factor BamB